MESHKNNIKKEFIKPQWPVADDATIKILKNVLFSGRWAISGVSVGKPSYNELASYAIAKFHEVPYCITCSNGSSALVIALEALGIKCGDEVLVPGLTWVACATAVLRIGAIPVFIDIDETNLCMSLEHAANSISSKTAAIILVHAYCCVADLDGFVKLSKDKGIPLIEDCSQAHGAKYHNRYVGTFGKVGVFSFQQTKVLTSGEGGAVITSDSSISERLMQLRADGRSFRANHKIGANELIQSPSIQGYNYCLSEFQAAILIDRIQHLKKENRQRTANGILIKNAIELIDGIHAVYTPDINNTPTIYKYAIQINNSKINKDLKIENLINKLTNLIGSGIEKLHPPIYASPLYKPLMSGRITTCQKKALDCSSISLSMAEKCFKNTFCIPHEYLLGNIEQIHILKNALLTLFN